MSKNCRRHCLATVEAGYQEEAQWKEEEKEKRKKEAVKRNMRGMKLSRTVGK